ncbi:MAG: DUF192 domain-containing protein [Actinomycetota bacterium]
MPDLELRGVPGVPVEIASTRAARRTGLLGRAEYAGVLVLAPCRQVHTFGMRFSVDVGFCGADGRLLRIVTLGPGRLSRPVWRARWVLEAEAGAFARWGLRCGDTVVVREHAGREP